MRHESLAGHRASQGQRCQEYHVPIEDLPTQRGQLLYVQPDRPQKLRFISARGTEELLGGIRDHIKLTLDTSENNGCH